MGTFVGWMAAVGVVLIAIGVAALGALLVMSQRILEGIDVILASIHIPDDEDDDTPTQEEFVGPANIPMSQSLMDVIGHPPTDTKDTGTFRGRHKWEPPPDEPQDKP